MPFLTYFFCQLASCSNKLKVWELRTICTICKAVVFRGSGGNTTFTIILLKEVEAVIYPIATYYVMHGLLLIELTT